MAQELVSPVITPFLLCFNLRYKALDIVDFFRNFTVDVVGVGDVCSFAQMDVKRHGNPEVCNTPAAIKLEAMIPLGLLYIDLTEQI